MAFLLRQLLLVLRCVLMLQPLYLQALFCLEFLPKDLFHFLVDVIGCLSIVDDLLLLQLDPLLHDSRFKLVLFGLLDDFPLEFDLLFEASDLLLQQAFSLIRFELILLTEDFADFALFSLV